MTREKSRESWAVGVGSHVAETSCCERGRKFEEGRREVMKRNWGVLALVAMAGVMAATGCKRGDDATATPAGDLPQSGAPSPGDPAQAGAPGTDDPSAQGGGSDDRGPRRARKHKGRHNGRWRHGQRRPWGGDPARDNGDQGSPAEP
jgi:hypothetical protein